MLLTFSSASPVFLVGWETKNWPQSFNEHWTLMNEFKIHDSPVQNEPSVPFRSGRNSNGTPWSLKLALNYFFIWVNEPPSVLLTDKSISFQINLRKSYHISTPPSVITTSPKSWLIRFLRTASQILPLKALVRVL